MILELTAPINDPYSPKPAGARLKVEYTDSIGQIHGEWLPPYGGSIAVIPEVDHYIVIEP